MRVKPLWHIRMCVCVFILITPFAFLFLPADFAATQWLKWAIVAQSELEAHCFSLPVTSADFYQAPDSFHKAKLCTVISVLHMSAHVNI